MYTVNIDSFIVSLFENRISNVKPIPVGYTKIKCLRLKGVDNPTSVVKSHCSLYTVFITVWSSDDIAFLDEKSRPDVILTKIPIIIINSPFHYSCFQTQKLFAF